MVYLKLLRIPTLLLSTSSIFMGIFSALSPTFVPVFQIFLLFFTALGLQIISNIANDYGDGLRGLDQERKIGFQRMFAAGKISKKQILLFLSAFIFITMLSGITLILISWRQSFWLACFWLIVGLACVLAAVKYSLGKKPHCMSYLGDFSVFLFFGLVAVLGSFSFIYGGVPPKHLLLEASAMGFLHVSVLNLNNIRDFEADKNNGRKTFAIQLGEKPAKIYQQCLVCGSFLLFFVAAYFFRIEKTYQLLVFLFFLPLFRINFSLNVAKSRYNKYIKKQCLLIFLFAFCYGSAFFGKLPSQ
jgi:1,4-dihydroxy-2-naphthoate octaprenyltransferase